MAIVLATEDTWEGFSMWNPDRSRVMLSAEGGSSSTSESWVISDVVEVLSSSSSQWGFSIILSSWVDTLQSYGFVKGMRFNGAGLVWVSMMLRVIGSRLNGCDGIVVSLGTGSLGYMARRHGLLSSEASVWAAASSSI